MWVNGLENGLAKWLLSGERNGILGSGYRFVYRVPSISALSLNDGMFHLFLALLPH